MRYAKKINGKTKEFNTLPTQWEGIIGFNYFSDSELEKYGFYSIEEWAPVDNHVKGVIYFDEENKVYKYKSIALTESQLVFNAIRAESKKYEQRIVDGQKMYAEISATFRLQKLSGQVSENDFKAVEEITKPIRTEILAGQWKEGLRILNSLRQEEIGEELWNFLFNLIAPYVEESYEL